LWFGIKRGFGRDGPCELIEVGGGTVDDAPGCGEGDVSVDREADFSWEVEEAGGLISSGLVFCLLVVSDSVSSGLGGTVDMLRSVLWCRVCMWIALGYGMEQCWRNLSVKKSERT
jgi:hypothetical protein